MWAVIIVVDAVLGIWVYQGEGSYAIHHLCVINHWEEQVNGSKTGGNRKIKGYCLKMGGKKRQVKALLLNIFFFFKSWKYRIKHTKRHFHMCTNKAKVWPVLQALQATVVNSKCKCFSLVQAQSIPKYNPNVQH